MKRVVIALGGNAIQKENAEASAEVQQQVIAETVNWFLGLADRGYEMILAHGNGPQVGNILLQQVAAHSAKLPAMPMDTCGAMSQGMIGYWMQQAIDAALVRNHSNKTCATVITQTVVSEEDPAFANPTKPIGPFYTEAEAQELMAEKGYVMMEDSGRGWRRVVPSPKPQEIVELPVIRALVEKGFLVVCTGGGGIPVIRQQDGTLHGVEAVIDKDLSGALLAESVDADALLILTEVNEVMLNFRQPNQLSLYEVSTTEMQGYIEEGHFAAGSMLPKVEAALRFVEAKSGRTAIITSLEKAEEALQGRAGTRIVS